MSRRLLLFAPMGLLIAGFALSILGLLWSSLWNGGLALYADLLADWGETARARALANETLAGTRRLPQHTRDAERAWIARLERRARG